MAHSHSHHHHHSSPKANPKYNSVAFLNRPFQILKEDAAQWILLGVSFLVYLFTLQPWVTPGDSASLVAAILNVTPDEYSSHFLWKNLMRLIAGSGPGMVFRLNLSSALFGAFSVFFLYRVILRLLSLFIEPTQLGGLPTSRYEEACARGVKASRLGATTAAIALAFSIPFWIASTRALYHSFYVCWLLLCFQFLLSFSRSRRLYWALLWAFFQAVGISQTSLFIDFLPFTLGYFFYVLWCDQHISATRAILSCLGVGLLGVSVIFISAYAYHYGYENSIFTHTYSYLNCVSRMVSRLINGTRGNLSQAPWLILIGLSIAPCLASLITARRALNGENTWSFLVLHGVIAVIVLLDVLDFRASPWRFLGTGDSTVIPYLLIAMTYGYAACYLYLLPFNLWAASDSDRTQRLLRVSTNFSLILFLVVPLAAAVSNYREAGNKDFGILASYCDDVLDSLEGRTWIVTDRSLDNHLLIRAKERNQTIHCINPSLRSLRLAREAFENVSLRNASNLGLQSLLQEWMDQKDSAINELALMKFPDFWGLGGLQMRPNKLVFLGETQEKLATLDVDQTLAEHNALWDRYRPHFESLEERAASFEGRKIPGDAPSYLSMLYLRHMIRPQMSFVGNNLGFTLSTLSRETSFPEETRTRLAESAFDTYSKIHELDPNNFSAILNWTSKVFARESSTDELKNKAREALSDLNSKIGENLSAMMHVWSLARNFGFVEDPTFFAVLGWTWANTGQFNLAMQAFSSAEEGLPEQNRTLIKSNIARLHLAASRPEESEKIYFEMLVEDSGNLEALMGLAHIYAFRGDTKQAREFLERAQKSGESIENIQIASATFYCIDGDVVRARTMLQNLLETNPRNTSAMSMLCAVMVEQRDVEGMKKVVESLEGALGPDHFQTLVSKAMLTELGEVDIAIAEGTDEQTVLREIRTTAREYYIRALRSRPGNLRILGRILSIDFSIADKASAREHALMILRQDRGEAFANYVLGSLAIDAEDYRGAEDYLRRSIERSPDVLNLNDLADVLFNLGQYDEAAVRVQQAFKLPDADKVYALWDTQGQIQMAQGHLVEAEASFQAALSIYGEDLRIHLHLAELLLNRGQKDNAAETVRAIARQADTLPRADRKKFEELHLKVLGVRYSKQNYK